MTEKTSITAEEVISNTLANWPRTVDAAKLCDELSAAGYKILPREPTEAMVTRVRETVNSINHLAIGDVAAAAALRTAWDHAK